MRQTHEELEAVKRYVELPYLMTIIENDKKKISDSDMRMKSVYTNHLDEIQGKVTVEIYKLKNYFKSNGIKIIEAAKTSDSLNVEYSIRGYTHKMVLLWSKVKVDVTLILTEYLRIDITQLK
ncbi:hypothetical protein HUB98_05820 [Paenibacillus barcinonensis]|uniref:Uncharacterized protein n=1 Tax=Paenibacillus barcinonensis TaxID=198119 RepID=A0A2V4W071_PAEBA|nr:hypothetical protein [Paenibacillus barcinonensis]PYE51515.1 hypothetical protein DFQ00_102309 [Paenibacillus barcinonensis]QKS55898.1 hypothetical protein HUB98_05820 [Paenibacillus barcinonensis]